MVEYHEPEYCYNCDTDATHFVVWKDDEGDIHYTYMCLTCCNAFELGQCTPEPALPIGG
jgi:hypothetical protein